MTPRFVALLIILLLVLPALPLAAASDPQDNARPVCGAWPLEARVQAACGLYQLTFDEPVCGVANDKYRCQVGYNETFVFTGKGCFLSTHSLVPVPGSYAGICGLAVIQRLFLHNGTRAFEDVPEGGQDVPVSATACISYRHGDFFQSEPDPARSVCETWTVGVVHLPGPPG